MSSTPSPWIRALVVIALVAAGCAAEPGGARPEAAGAELPEGSSPARSPDDAVVARADAERALRVGEPRTLRLELPPEAAAMVERLGSEGAEERTLRLTLEDMDRPESTTGVRVFVNRPEATASTPMTDPGFVAEVGFFVIDTSFLLDVGQALARLPAEERLEDGRFLDVTLVAVSQGEPGPESAAPVEIPFRGVRLSLH